MRNEMHRIRLLIWILVAAGVGVAFALAPWSSSATSGAPADNSTSAGPSEFAIFAGGCFWCVESDFEHLDGVIEAVSGYTGGHTKNPTYKDTSAGGTGHAEAVRVEYDPSRITYEELLDAFWPSIDPTVANRQFCDKGSQYRSAIFVSDARQRAAAEASLRELEQTKPFEGEIYTQIEDATTFYEAEEYHQDYAKKNPIRYNLYRRGCGRDRRLQEIWGEEE